MKSRKKILSFFVKSLQINLYSIIPLQTLEKSVGVNLCLLRCNYAFAVIFLPLLYHKTVYNHLALPVYNHTTLYSPRLSVTYTFRQRCFFSADLCYNETNEKPLPPGEVAAQPTERVNCCNDYPLTRYRGSSPMGRAFKSISN